MDYTQLRQKTTYKVLLRGPSGTGKTRNAVKISLDVLEQGGRVLYVDTESEAANTFVEFIERGEYSKDVVEGLEHVLVREGDKFIELLQSETQEQYDLVVYDTLDSKHTYAVKEVTDAKTASEADWNMYPVIYDYEKQLMEEIGKPKATIIACLDPQSGKKDKPKGCQTNISGYFSTVLTLQRKEQEGNQVYEVYIENWVGDLDGKFIGKKATGSNYEQVISKVSGTAVERSGLVEH